MMHKRKKLGLRSFAAKPKQAIIDIKILLAYRKFCIQR